MASVYATSASYYVYATATWDSNLNVTVTIDSANSGWCVKIRGTSTIKCQGSSSNRTGTFTADYDGQEFVLQVYDGEEESFVNNGSPFFTVTNNSGGSGSGSEGGNTGGGDIVSSKIPIRIYAGFGCSVSVKTAYNELVLNDLHPDTNGFEYYGNCDRSDKFKIEVSALDGYILDSYKIFDYNSGSYDEFNYDVENLVYNASDDTWSTKDSSTSVVEIRVSATPIEPDYGDETLSVFTDIGTKLNILRTKTSDTAIAEGSYLGELTNGKHAYCNGYHCTCYPIWKDDHFIVQTELLDGYILDRFECSLDKAENTEEVYFPLYETYAEIHAYSVQSESPGDGGGNSGGSSSGGGIFIGDGTNLVKYRGYIDNGTSWDLIGSALKNIGTCTTDNNGSATVNCGFKPDLVYIYVYDDTRTIESGFCAPFSEMSTNYDMLVFCTGPNNVGLGKCLFTQTETGFTINVKHLNDNWDEGLVTNVPFDYKAIKYT